MALILMDFVQRAWADWARQEAAGEKKKLQARWRETRHERAVVAKKSKRG